MRHPINSRLEPPSEDLTSTTVPSNVHLVLVIIRQRLHIQTLELDHDVTRIARQEHNTAVAK